MFCPTCGSLTETDDRFCQHCGRPLTVAPGPPAAPAEPAVEDPFHFPPYVEPAPGPYPGGDAAPPPRTAPDGWGPANPPGPAYPGQTPSWTGHAPGVPLAPFGAPLAGWWQRVGSMLLDVLIVGVPMGVLSAILNTAFGTLHRVTLANGTITSVRTLEGGGRIALVIAEVCVPLLYFAILNGTGRGQTAGNHAPHIAVRDLDTGEVIGFWRGVVRWLIRLLLYVAFIIPGLLNDLFPLWDSRHQSIADKAARSVVIRLD